MTEKTTVEFSYILYFLHNFLIQVGDVFRLILAAKTCVVSNDLPLRLVDTDVVVTTPQHIMTYPLQVLNDTQTIVVDEADVMIARKKGKHGKQDPLFNLIAHFTDFTDNSSNYRTSDYRTSDRDDITKKQFVFVGATMPDSNNVKSKKAVPYIRSWFPDVHVLQANNTHKLNQTSDISFLRVEPANKVNLLMNVLSEFTKSSERKTFNVIIYVNSVKAADNLYNRLNTDPPSTLTFSDNKNTSSESDFNKENLYRQFHEFWYKHIHIVHRNIPKEQRIHSFNEFSNSPRGILITTDVTSRGLDFQDVGLVVQYDFATNYVDVIHRAGRTGRMGRTGMGETFFNAY